MCNHNHSDEFMVHWVGLESGLGDDDCRSAYLNVNILQTAEDTLITQNQSVQLLS